MDPASPPCSGILDSQRERHTIRLTAEASRPKPGAITAKPSLG